MRIRWRYIRRTVGVVLLLILIGAVIYGVVNTVQDSRHSGTGAGTAAVGASVTFEPAAR